jgi:hypothetical protein
MGDFIAMNQVDRIHIAGSAEAVGSLQVCSASITCRRDPQHDELLTRHHDTRVAKNSNWRVARFGAPTKENLHLSYLAPEKIVWLEQSNWRFPVPPMARNIMSCPSKSANQNEIFHIFVCGNHRI